MVSSKENWYLRRDLGARSEGIQELSRGIGRSIGRGVVTTGPFRNSEAVIA